MLLPGDNALLFKFDLGPLAFRNDRPGKPVHIQAKIMQPMQIDVGRNRPALEHFQKRVGSGFDDDALSDQIEGLVVAGSLPPQLIRAVFTGGRPARCAG